MLTLLCVDKFAGSSLIEKNQVPVFEAKSSKVLHSKPISVLEGSRWDLSKFISGERSRKNHQRAS
jgi:hypothetical protein